MLVGALGVEYMQTLSLPREAGKTIFKRLSTRVHEKEKRQWNKYNNYYENNNNNKIM